MALLVNGQFLTDLGVLWRGVTVDILHRVELDSWGADAIRPRGVIAVWVKG